MRNLVAARRVNASLIRIAATVPVGNPFRRVLLAWAKMASAQEDQFLRLSYIEGALGYEPNSLVRKPIFHLGEARRAISSGDYDSDPIARKLINDLAMSPAEALKFVSANDQGIWNGLVSTAISQMKPSGTIRGLSAQAIVNSIVFGISPVTGNWLKYGAGKGMMYWLGTQAYPGVELAGVKSISKKEIANRTKDVVRGTSLGDRGMVSLDQPAFEADFESSPAAILETLTSEEQGGFTEDLASAILRYGSTLKIISPVVLANLRTPTQKAVWEIVRDNPSILTLTGGEIGVEGRELAKLFASRTGQEYTGKSMDVVMAKVFKAVLPEMFKAIKNDAAAKELIRSRDILQVMREEIARRPRFETNRGIGVSGEPDQKVPSWKGVSKEDPRWKQTEKLERARRQKMRQQNVPLGLFASSKSALIRLASMMTKGSAERKTLLKLAQDIQTQISKDAVSGSKNQNKPESYYGLAPKGIQASAAKAPARGVQASYRTK